MTKPHHTVKDVIGMCILAIFLTLASDHVFGHEHDNDEKVIRLNLGMDTTHYSSDGTRRTGLNESNQFVGLSYGGELVDRANVLIDTSTFINSYGRRSYSLGGSVEFMIMDDWKDTNIGTGVSNGLIHGYHKDELKGAFMGDETVIYVAPYVYASYKWIGVSYRVLGQAHSLEAVIDFSDLLN